MDALEEINNYQINQDELSTSDVMSDSYEGESSHQSDHDYDISPSKEYKLEEMTENQAVTMWIASKSLNVIPDSDLVKSVLRLLSGTQGELGAVKQILSIYTQAVNSGRIEVEASDIDKIVDDLQDQTIKVPPLNQVFDLYIGGKKLNVGAVFVTHALSRFSEHLYFDPQSATFYSGATEKLFTTQDVATFEVVVNSCWSEIASNWVLEDSKSPTFGSIVGKAIIQKNVSVVDQMAMQLVKHLNETQRNATQAGNRKKNNTHVYTFNSGSNTTSPEFADLSTTAFLNSGELVEKTEKALAVSYEKFLNALNTLLSRTGSYTAFSKEILERQPIFVILHMVQKQIESITKTQSSSKSAIGRFFSSNQSFNAKSTKKIDGILAGLSVLSLKSHLKLSGVADGYLNNLVDENSVFFLKKLLISYINAQDQLFKLRAKDTFDKEIRSTRANMLNSFCSSRDFLKNSRFQESALKLKEANQQADRIASLNATKTKTVNTVLGPYQPTNTTNKYSSKSKVANCVAMVNGGQLDFLFAPKDVVKQTLLDLIGSQSVKYFDDNDSSDTTHAINHAMLPNMQLQNFRKIGYLFDVSHNLRAVLSSFFSEILAIISNAKNQAAIALSQKTPEAQQQIKKRKEEISLSVQKVNNDKSFLLCIPRTTKRNQLPSDLYSSYRLTLVNVTADSIFYKVEVAFTSLLAEDLVINQLLNFTTTMKTVDETSKYDADTKVVQSNVDPSKELVLTVPSRYHIASQCKEFAILTKDANLVPDDHQADVFTDVSVSELFQEFTNVGISVPASDQVQNNNNNNNNNTGADIVIDDRRNANNKRSQKIGEQPLIKTIKRKGGSKQRLEKINDK